MKVGRVVRATLVSWSVAICCLASGCQMFYRHARTTQDYAIYTDASRGQLETLEALLDEALIDFRKIFPRRAQEVPPPRVILDEDPLTRRRIYTAGLRQEGYYLPWLRLIHLSPREQLNDDPSCANARAVLVHELAHHFLVLGTPTASPRTWLNEGLACALESMFRAPDGQPVTPLLHPWLHRQAYATLRALGPQAVSAELATLRGGTWLRFHRSPTKVRNYALAWAFSYHLLNTRRGGLEDRVQELLELPEETIDAEIPGFLAWLAQDPDAERSRCAADPLLRDWMLGCWVDEPGVNGGRVVEHLRVDLAAPHAHDQAVAHERLTRLLNHAFLRGVSSEERRALSRRIAMRLWHAPAHEQQSIAQALAPGGREAIYHAPLIALLEAPGGELRASAAGALARLTDKPTITRPEFWLHASPEARHAEVVEWQAWLVAQRASGESPPCSPAPPAGESSAQHLGH